MNLSIKTIISSLLTSLVFACDKRQFPVAFVVSIMIFGSVDVKGQSVPIDLDSFVVVAKKDFEIEDFMDKVVTDTTFYKAFVNMRYYPHRSRSKLFVYNRREEEKGAEYKKTRQHLSGENMWVTTEWEKDNGKIKNRKGEYKWTTALVYNMVFFPEDTAEVTPIAGPFEEEEDRKGREGRYYNDMKTMMFRPGADVNGVPIVGKRMSIFDKDMQPYYNYYITYDEYRDSIPCYVFTCAAKPDARDSKTVIKELKTWFTMDNMTVMKRSYKMDYSHLMFDFDVDIMVENDLIGGKLLPKRIRYKGWWKVPMRKRESMEFDIVNYAYRAN